MSAVIMAKSPVAIMNKLLSVAICYYGTQKFVLSLVVISTFISVGSHIAASFTLSYASFIVAWQPLAKTLQTQQRHTSRGKAIWDLGSRGMEVGQCISLLQSPASEYLYN